MGLLAGRSGGGRGTYSRKSGVGIVVVKEGEMEVGAGGGAGGGDDRITPPVHASRLAIYVRNPSFHRISSSTLPLRLRFRVLATPASASGVSYLYGSGAAAS